MNKKTIKILSTIFMVMLIITMATSVFALDPSAIKAEGTVTGSEQIKNAGVSIVGILQTVGVVLSVVMLIIIGIKYMMGSAEEKAEYKKTMMPYIVGAALIFAASIFANVVYQFFSGMNK